MNETHKGKKKCERIALKLETPENSHFAQRSAYFVVPRKTRMVTKIFFTTETEIDIAKFSIHLIY